MKSNRTSRRNLCAARRAKRRDYSRAFPALDIACRGVFIGGSAQMRRRRRQNSPHKPSIRQRSR
jgi:hypothetical protein